MEDRKSAGLGDKNNPKWDKAMVEQVVANGGKNRENSSSEKSGETEECMKKQPTLQGPA